MRTSLLTHCLVVFCCLFGSFAFAQPQPLSRPAEVPTLALPALNNDALLEAELLARKPGRAPMFAEVRPVDVRPATHGAWTNNDDGTTTWRLRVSSPTAHSLNLGFTEFYMPAGGELYLTTGTKENWQTQGPYTPADNEVHDQLWTPMFDGDELIVEVTLPAAERENLRLWLTHVNHDFLDFDRAVKSGSCNVDVVCSAADGLPIVDLYRDIIRSVAVISTGGNTFCTGFLVNNARNDGTPYFMTANHCGIGAGNAPSLVTYWNFENSTCRAPGSAASGGNGDGVLNVNNTGAIWRASNPASDMTIVELDDPVNPAADAFFAGWDNSYDVPTDTVIGIHHPSTDEKRISFTFQQTYFTAGFNGSPNPTGSHLHIPDWDIGTTEPGSSGSPVFDRFSRVRGQLHGGGAACGNDLYDTYGAVAASWEGGGTPSSRLRDWLDPDDLGVTFVDGRDVNEPQATVNAGPLDQTVCGTDPAEYSIAIGGGFAGDVTLTIEDLPSDLAASFSSNPAAPGSTVVLTITPNAGAGGDYAFTVTGANGPDSDQAGLGLTVSPAAPGAPALLSPPNVATNVSLSPTLTWGDIPGSVYDYEVATENTFDNIVRSGTALAEAFESIAPLEQGTNYFWRVRASNPCGDGPWSMTRLFTTLSVVCGAEAASVDVPVTISSSGTPTITSDLTLPAGDPLESLEVNLEVDHSWVGDLEIVLTSPDGISVTLVDRIGFAGSGFGCGGDNLVLTLTDLADQTYAELENSCGNLPAASGTYQPAQPLSAFSGADPAGVWTLSITDNADFDGGTLVNWSLVPCAMAMTLPVELSSFAGTSSECGSDLKWTASSEQAFSHYEVERSANGRDFVLVDKISARPDGQYAFRVADTKGTTYFRLRMVDADGTFAYSAVITTSNDCGKPGISALYPNPTTAGGELTVQFDRPLAGTTDFDVFGADGRRLLTVAGTPGVSSQRIDLGDMPAGTYILRMITDGEVVTKAFVIGR